MELLKRTFMVWNGYIKHERYHGIDIEEIYDVMEIAKYLEESVLLHKGVTKTYRRCSERI